MSSTKNTEYTGSPNEIVPRFPEDCDKTAKDPHQTFADAQLKFA